MSGYRFALVLAAAVILLLVHLLRTRRIREKYAAIWIVLTVAVCVLGAFPHLLLWVSSVAGVVTPVNLLFAVAAMVLLAVSLQLSGEVSTLEEETRTLAEEIALLGLTVRELEPGDGKDQPVDEPEPDVPHE